jgi:hypothetical protein
VIWIYLDSYISIYWNMSIYMQIQTHITYLRTKVVKNIRILENMILYEIICGDIWNKRYKSKIHLELLWNELFHRNFGNKISNMRSHSCFLLGGIYNFYAFYVWHLNNACFWSFYVVLLHVGIQNTWHVMISISLFSMFLRFYSSCLPNRVLIYIPVSLYLPFWIC